MEESDSGSSQSDDKRLDEPTPRASGAPQARPRAWFARARSGRDADRSGAHPAAGHAPVRPGGGSSGAASAVAPAPRGTSNFSRAEVPWGVDLAAAWSWRILVIVAAGWVLLQAVELLAVVLLPVVVALFIAALTTPAVQLLSRWMPRGLASLLVVVGVLGSVVLMLSFATQQVVQGASDLSDQVVAGLEQIQEWLREGPLGISQQQLNDLLKQAQDLAASSNEVVGRVTEVSTTLGHVVAGIFIVLFSTYFFLADGDRIWAWLVRLFPAAARGHADSSGQVAWLSLTQFVRATVLVAAVDAIGVMVVAALLRVPFVGAIGVLVFLGAFIPVVGAAVSGLIAVLVALVDEGALAALLMLLGVIGVQQLEAHLLQPFLMGRMVRLHPLGVILAVASGVIIAGIAGALVAVPVAASVNAVALHLSGRGSATETTSSVTSDDEEAVDPAADPEEDGVS